MAFRQSLNVGRVIQVTLSLQLNEPGIVLSHALHTLMTGSDRMCTPVGRGQFLMTVRANGNSAVKDRNQVSIGDQVEDMASPGAINAGKQVRHQVVFSHSLNARGRSIASGETEGCRRWGKGAH